jgi:hypothetical protein
MTLSRKEFVFSTAKQLAELSSSAHLHSVSGSTESTKAPRLKKRCQVREGEEYDLCKRENASRRRIATHRARTSW